MTNQRFGCLSSLPSLLLGPSHCWLTFAAWLSSRGALRLVIERAANDSCPALSTLVKVPILAAASQASVSTSVILSNQMNESYQVPTKILLS